MTPDYIRITIEQALNGAVIQSHASIPISAKVGDRTPRTVDALIQALSMFDPAEAAQVPSQAAQHFATPTMPTAAKRARLKSGASLTEGSVVNA